MASHKTINCEKCNEVIPLNSRSRHQAKCHNEKELLQCLECKYQTKIKGNLETHLKSHQKKGKEMGSFQCPHCKKNSSMKKNLNRHLKNHLIESVFNCNICDKKFKSKYNLNCHMIAIHQEKKILDSAVKFKEN